MVGEWSTSRPGGFTPGKDSVLGTHRIGGWVDPRAGLEVVENLDPSEIQYPDRPARSQSLYRLSYPGPRSITVLVITLNIRYTMS